MVAFLILPEQVSKPWALGVQEQKDIEWFDELDKRKLKHLKFA